MWQAQQPRNELDDWVVAALCTFNRVVLLLIFIAIVCGLCAGSAYAQVPDAAHQYRQQYSRIVRSEWGLNGPVASLAAQISQESQWDCRAVSRVGARGCAQFMPTTATWIGEVDSRLKAGDLSSPTWAFRAQAVYMKWLHDRVKGSAPCEQMAFAMSAYNGGLGWVYRRQKISSRPGVCLGATCDINPGVTPASQHENARYPQRILRELEPRYVNAGWGVGSCS
jgi:soluble lytic murein transglycosylase-like protein